MEVTRLKTAAEIRLARDAFEQYVTSDVYAREFAAIGQGFKPMALIGALKQNIYVKCEKEGKVVGLAYGHPDGDDAVFYIADIIAAVGSGSGSEMCAWFADKDHVGMPNLRMLALTAANSGLQTVYSKDRYGFKLKDASTGRMEKALA